MKRAVILAAYVAIAVVDAALGQQFTDRFYVPLQPSPPAAFDTLPTAKAVNPPPSPPGWSVITAPAEPTKVLAPLGSATPIMPPKLLPQLPIVIRFGKGGKVDEHRQLFSGYQRAKAKVEIRGPCYSACTLVLAYVEPDNLCIAPGGFMAFHAIRTELGLPMVGATQQYYSSMPPLIRQWIRDNGGWQNLPLDAYWTMYDRELWGFGYPRCAP